MNGTLLLMECLKVWLSLSVTEPTGHSTLITCMKVIISLPSVLGNKKISFVNIPVILVKEEQ